MIRVIKVVFGLGIVAAAALGFGLGFNAWHGLAADQSADVLAIYMAAAAGAAVLFLAAQMLKAHGTAFYLIIGGAVFLAVDVVVWQRTGIMPSAKFLRGGFPPAGIMGLFLGVIYRAIAVPAAVRQWAA